MDRKEKFGVLNVIGLNMAEKNYLVFKELKMDLSKKSVFIGNNKIELNERLYHLLEYFLLNQGILLFKEQIFARICGYDSDASIEIVEVYISHLRKKLGQYDYGKYFKTKRGMGYILEE